MRLYWLAGLGLLVCGCGLADYEQKMTDAQARVQRYEEENRVLGPNLHMPMTTNDKGKKVRALDVFLRPPLGINPKTSNQSDPLGGRLYNYDRPRTNPVGSFARVQLAVGDVKEKDFIAELIKAGWGAVSHPAPTPRSVQPMNRPARTFHTTEFEDGTYFYSVNVFRGRTRQVAVVYWVDRKQKDASKRALQISLESFVGEGERVINIGPLDVVPRPPS
jgi:hypothetical protein